MDRSKLDKKNSLVWLSFFISNSNFISLKNDYVKLKKTEQIGFFFCSKSQI